MYRIPVQQTAGINVRLTVSFFFLFFVQTFIVCYYGMRNTIESNIRNDSNFERVIAQEKNSYRALLSEEGAGCPELKKKTFSRRSNVVDE